MSKTSWEGSFEANGDQTRSFDISAYGSSCQTVFWEVKREDICDFQHFVIKDTCMSIKYHIFELLVENTWLIDSFRPFYPRTLI